MLNITGLWNTSLHLLFLSVLFCSVDIVFSGFTSSFVRTEWPAVDIPLDSEEFAVPKDQNSPQQVHITQGDYDGKAVIISWVTLKDPGTNEVLYGRSQHTYNHSAKGTTTNYTYYDYKSGYIHHCLIDGLEYDTKYYYKIGTGGSAREFWFHMPPKIDPDASYTFGIIGDLGQTYNSLSTLEHYMQSGGQTILFVGDLSYADRYVCNNGTRWDSWGRFVERSAAYQPWIWTTGNHELEYRPDLGEVSTFKAFLHRFATPHVASGSSSPLWYAIRRASAHIIVLSSYSPFVKYTPQWHWLQYELQRVDREKTPWLIVLMHAPLYNSNEAHYMEGESMRVVFESWFVRYKVDIVFAGHVHAYERSPRKVATDDSVADRTLSATNSSMADSPWPEYRISNINYNITSGLCYPVPDKSAPVYITVGDGGNQEGLASRFSEIQPDYSAFREASYGHSTLELKNRTHAFYRWNRNDDGKSVQTDHVIFHNQYWASNNRRRRLKKDHRSQAVDRLISTY